MISAVKCTRGAEAQQNQEHKQKQLQKAEVSAGRRLDLAAPIGARRFANSTDPEKALRVKGS